MANVQHVDLTDPYVHEPKDITTALSGQAYIADGSSSGSWAYPKPSNVVIVEAASQFPGQGSGTITLAANTVYQIVGSIDIGTDRLVFSANTVVRGNNTFSDGIVSSTTGSMCTVTDVSGAKIESCFLTCSSGTFLDLDGTGTENFAVIRTRIICDSIGDVDNVNLVNFERTIVVATSDGITFTGATSNAVLFFPVWTVSTTNSTVIDLQTATFDRFYLINGIITNPSGTGFGLDVAAAGANINSGGLGIVSNTTFSTAANATNYVEGDAAWEKLGTPDMPPTIAKAQGYVDANANANSFGGGVGVDEVVNFGTSFVADVEDKFTISTAGRFTYTGSADTTVLAQATARVTMGGGASRVRNLKWAKNGTVIESSISSKSLDGTNEGTYACNSIITLATNDYVELYIEPETSTTSTTVDTCSIMVHEVH